MKKTINSTAALPQKDIDALLKFYHAGDYETLENRARHLLKKSSDVPMLHVFLGVGLAGQNKWDESVENYIRAIQLQPDYPEAYTNLGAVLRSQGKIDLAVVQHTKALNLNPDFSEAWYNLGIALQELGQPDKAYSCYERAIELKPGYAGSYYNMHALLIDQGKLKAAIACLQKAVQLVPQNLKYKFYLGICLEYSGTPGSDIPYFDEIENHGTKADKAWLDAWRYIKSAGEKLPLLIGSGPKIFETAINASPSTGLILEFGVRHGTSIRMISALAHHVPIHGFDSFEGLPEAWHHEPAGSYSTNKAIPEVPDNITLHAGWFENSLPPFVKDHPGPVRLMNIDCDIYSSTKTILENFAGQIGPGTVLIFDEYIGNAHWREDEFKAFKEAVKAHGWQYEYLAVSFFTKQAVVRIK